MLWSRSQHATGELFLALKRNQDEPDATAAALVGLPLDAAAAAAAGVIPPAAAAAAAAGSGSQAAGDDNPAAAGPAVISSSMLSQSPALAAQQSQQAAANQDSVVNQAAIDLLRRLPGVTDVNWRLIINGCSSLRDLCDMSEQQLERLMQSQRGARALYNFLHAPCPVAQSAGIG